MPGVVGREHAEGIGGPTANQLRTAHGQRRDVDAAPVVTDQVDRSAEQLQLRRQPVSIGRRRRVEAAGRGDAEPGRGQDDRVGPVELPDERSPDDRGLGVAVDEDEWSARHEATSQILVG
jgi:hypothetical protein